MIWMANDVFLINMGQRIAKRRKELHLTQEQLAEKMGVSLQTVSCIELGKKAIRPENLANLCTHLDVSADYIIYGKREEKQMLDIVAKLSELPQREFCMVQDLITLLHQKTFCC